MTQATPFQEFRTGSGAFRAARIAFVHSLWHGDIVREAHAGFIDEIVSLGFAESAIERFETPGAFEIPLHAQTLARSGRYAAIVAAGFVVDGGIYRHEFVAETVIRALMQVQLATETPVFSVVLTPHHFHESDVHQRFFHGHFRLKGAEAARACHGTLESLARIAGRRVMAVLDVPAGFAPHFRQSPLTDPWEPLYSRTTNEAVILGLRAGPAHTNSRGFVHGGLISALADNAMGLSCARRLGGVASLVTVNLNVDFLGSGLTGQWLEFETAFVRPGSTLCFAQAFVTADGQPCARANGIFRVVKRSAG